MLSFLFITSIFSSPAYEIEIVNDIQSFPTTGDIFKVPYKNNYLMCISSDKRKSYCKTDLSYEDMFKNYANGCRGFSLDGHFLIFCYNQTSKYDNTAIGSRANITMENGSLIYTTSGGEECIENNQTTTYKLEAKLDCDASLPKKKMECPAFWKRGNCTIQTVLKTNEFCQHPFFRSKGYYKVKCISQSIFEKELNRLEEN